MTKQSPAQRPPEWRLQFALREAAETARASSDETHLWASRGWGELDDAAKLARFTVDTVKKTRAAFQELKAELSVIHAAREEWRPFARTCADITFINGAGHTVAVPEPLARQLATDEGLAAVIEEETHHLVFKRGKRVWCRIPKSLAVSLKTILQGYRWDAPPPAE